MIIKKSNFSRQGFALLYAILLSGAVLTVGVILMNIITKQMIYSSVSRNSELAYYYAANSGRECLMYFAVENHRVFYNQNRDGDYRFKNNVKLSCLDKESITLFGPSSLKKRSLHEYESEEISIDGSIVTLKVTFNTDCLSGHSSCCGLNLTDRYGAVLVAEGYSSDPSSLNSRIAKRTAIAVQK